ncbi:MAG: protein kinase [Deltaproteobacteria bacterium]|nr:protein kinase [Deltaproteobacteria bacterium]
MPPESHHRDGPPQVPSDPTATMDEFSAPPPVADPERLGRFRVVRRLGQGAMGVVYEALDEGRGQRVAIKAMHRLGPERVYRFKREFRALTGVRHPNVVGLHELVSDGEQLFFTMELVRGTDFITDLCGPAIQGRRHPPCRDRERLRSVMRQLADGVQAIHEAGILHRDIKPSNVLVATDGRVVLLDFGLVREHGVDEHVGVTADGALLGTPMYMAPEQATGGQVGPPADWYAVGELLYHALTGVPPFHQLGMLAMLAAKRDTTPPPPSTLVDDVPLDLEALCVALLVPDAAARPTGPEIVAKLGAVAGRGGGLRVGEAFHGRSKELAVLRDAYVQAAREPVLVLIEGPSGIGKTALAQHFAAEVAGRDDALVLGGRCSERESIPYKALDAVMDALALRLGVHSDPRYVDALLPRDVRSIARLFPVLRGVPAIALAAGRREDDPEPVDARRRAIAALADMLARIADRRRLVIRIDDFQWADHDSAVLLGGVLRQVDPPSVLIVLTVRDGAQREGTPLQRLLAEVAERDRALDVRRLSLGPLPAAEAEELALELLGARARRARALARDIVREADGSPFFVGELVRYAKLLESGEGLAVDQSVVSLDNVIRGRLARLPALVRRVLDVAAVAGGRTTQRIALSVACGVEPDPGAIQRLVDERLARVGGSNLDDSLEIDHDRIRETVLAQLDAAQLAALHLDIANALSAAGVADEPALAHHFRAAGENRLAKEHTLAAADQAAAALAFDRAAELYRIALSLEMLAASDYAEVEAKMADALANAGRLLEAARAYRRAAERGGPLAIEWRRRAAEHLLTAGYTDEGRAALDEALRAVGLALPTSNTRAIGSLLLDRARLAVSGLRPQPAAAGDEAELVRLDVCWAASRGLVFTDGLVGAAFHAQHLRLALKRGEPVRVARALAAEAHLMTALGADAKLAEADALIERARAIAESTGSAYARGIVAECAGSVAISVGDWARAYEALEDATSIFREHCTGVSHEIGICRAHSAFCLQFLGRVPELRERAYALLDETRDRPNPYVSGFARGILGNMALLAPDRVDEAAEQLSIYQHDVPRRFEAHLINYVCQTAALERYRGRAERAWAMAVDDRPRVAKLGVRRSPHANSEILLWQAQNALAGATVVRDPASRLVDAERPIDALLHHPSVFARAYGELSRAGAQALSGRTDEAVAALERAIEGFEQRQMRAFAAAALRRLAALQGGSAGREAQARSDAAMATMGVVRPDAFTDMMAPGFVRA